MSDVLTMIKGRRGAISALAVTALACALLIGIAIVALLHAAEGDTQAALSQLALYRAQVAERPKVEAQLKDVLQRAASSPGLIEAPTTAQAQARLESDVKAIAQNAGADIRSTEIVPATPVGDFETIAIEYNLSVPMSRLRDLTYAIEARSPYLFIDHVSITSRQSWQSDDQSARDPALDVRWTILGYRWAAKR